MKKELLSELNGYLEAVKTHNEEYGVRPDTTAAVSLEGFALYLDKGKVHESDKRTLGKLVKEQEKIDAENEEAVANQPQPPTLEPSN